MTREDVIRLAKEANIYVGGLGSLQNANLDTLERFAALVAAKEREACAKVCEELDEHPDHLHPNDCAISIRARGQQ